jgi:sensor histidine kinase regulating citrate/malate metabolism
MNGPLKDRHQSQRLAALARVVKIAGAIMAVMIFALGVLSVMALEKFNSSLKDVTESRIGVIAFDVQDNIEQGLALGINLPALQNVQDTIRRALARDAKISAIYVIGRQGETLYRVPDGAPDLTPEAAEKFRKASTKGPLASLRDGSFLNAFAPLQNSFSQTVGILLIKYDASSLEARYAAFRALFFRQVMLFLFGGVAVATVAIWILLKKFDAMDAVLAASLDSNPDPGAAGDLGRPAELAAFKAKEYEALEAIAAAEKLLVAR